MQYVFTWGGSQFTFTGLPPAYYHNLIRKELDLIQISSVIIYCIDDMTLQFEQLSLNQFPDI